MKRANLNAQSLLIVCILNLVVIMSNNKPGVEAVFFLDILCASRIESLERQVAQLISLSQNANSNRYNNNNNQLNNQNQQQSNQVVSPNMGK